MPEPTPAAADLLPESPHPEPVDILIVDDNPAKVLAIESILEPLGQNLVRAHGGREALRTLLTRDFATVILDVHMPDLDGFATAQMIRSRERSRSTPIIFVSAINTDEADAFRGYALGGVDYILAPIVPEILRAKVLVFVELYRKTQEALSHARRLQEQTRRLEASQHALRLAERMATIGTLCAGLGHDMGNLLLPISIWIDAIKREQLAPDVEEGIEQIRTGVQYLRKLAAGLRLVALDSDAEVGSRCTNPQSWLEETAPVYRNALPRGVRFECAVESDLPTVRIPPHHLTQIVFNLVQNAGDVLRERSGTVRLIAAREAGGVRFAVEDDGPGMPPDVLARCFDPFFTTKTRAVSTGLGLALVHALLQRSGAAIDARSTVGQGSSFSFLLPIHTPKPEHFARALLTVEDPRVRGVARGFLRASGFHIADSPADIGSEPAIWVSDIGSVTPADVARFESIERRVVLLLGDPPNPDAPPELLARRVTGGIIELQNRVKEFAMSSEHPEQITAAGPTG